ncbi:Type 4 prepilin-like proteins leader peptide-processing enzyme [BD1-7 clade bacterium]|uniref:Prepilin leader peptidase/N-methyltransferase n=1 Tax=BD1-7 clade bacterium TaxID=2029982 RepID=A0A5S9N3Y5_9GAMM|nr:Type 4 prepilin-like proteins leader peptide-processing enzyme [BD1-7 clade bacterium]
MFDTLTLDLASAGLEVFWFAFSLVVAVSLMIGSFLNVVIYRLPIMMQRQWQAEARYLLSGDEEQKVDAEAGSRDEATFNLAYPGSACPHCHTSIKAWQNMPVLSYLLLKGKCGNCKAPISPRYPFVEALTALLAAVAFFQYPVLIQLLPLLLLTYCLVALTGIDFDHQLLPDSITLPLLWLGLALNTVGVFTDLSSAVWGAIGGYGVLWLVYWAFKLVTGKEGMGYGDFKLMGALGAWFGWQVLPNVILLSSVVGAILGIALIVLRGRDSQQPLPFGPFIAIAGWLTVMFPETLTVSQYLHS